MNRLQKSVLSGITLACLFLIETGFTDLSVTQGARKIFPGRMGSSDLTNLPTICEDFSEYGAPPIQWIDGTYNGVFGQWKIITSFEDARFSIVNAGGCDQLDMNCMFPLAIDASASYNFSYHSTNPTTQAPVDIRFDFTLLGGSYGWFWIGVCLGTKGQWINDLIYDLDLQSFRSADASGNWTSFSLLSPTGSTFILGYNSRYTFDITFNDPGKYQVSVKDGAGTTYTSREIADTYPTTIAGSVQTLAFSGNSWGTAEHTHFLIGNIGIFPTTAPPAIVRAQRQSYMVGLNGFLYELVPALNPSYYTTTQIMSATKLYNNDGNSYDMDNNGIIDLVMGNVYFLIVRGGAAIQRTLTEDGGELNVESNGWNFSAANSHYFYTVKLTGAVAGKHFYKTNVESWNTQYSSLHDYFYNSSTSDDVVYEIVPLFSNSQSSNYTATMNGTGFPLYVQINGIIYTIPTQIFRYEIVNPVTSLQSGGPSDQFGHRGFLLNGDGVPTSSTPSTSITSDAVPRTLGSTAYYNDMPWGFMSSVGFTQFMDNIPQEYINYNIGIGTGLAGDTNLKGGGQSSIDNTNEGPPIDPWIEPAGGTNAFALQMFIQSSSVSPNYYNSRDWDIDSAVSKFMVNYGLFQASMQDLDLATTATVSNDVPTQPLISSQNDLCAYARSINDTKPGTYQGSGPWSVKFDDYGASIGFDSNGGGTIGFDYLDTGFEFDWQPPAVPTPTWAESPTPASYAGISYTEAIPTSASSSALASTWGNMVEFAYHELNPGMSIVDVHIEMNIVSYFETVFLGGSYPTHDFTQKVRVGFDMKFIVGSYDETGQGLQQDYASRYNTYNRQFGGILANPSTLPAIGTLTSTAINLGNSPVYENLTFTNNNIQNKTVDVVVAGLNPSWFSIVQDIGGTQVAQSLVIVPAGTTRKVAVKIAVPLDGSIAPGTYNYSIDVFNAQNPLNEQSFPCSLDILPTAAFNAWIDANASTPNIHAGESGIIQLDIKNIGNLNDDTYGLNGSGIDFSWITGISMNPVGGLNYGQTGQVDFTITPPTDAKVGTYPFAIWIQSKADPYKITKIQGFINVLPCRGASLSVSSQIINAQQGNIAVIPVAIKNLQNATTFYKLEATGIKASCVSFAGGNIVQVDANAIKIVNMTILQPVPFAIGQSTQAWNVTISATSLADSALTNSVWFDVIFHKSLAVSETFFFTGFPASTMNQPEIFMIGTQISIQVSLFNPTSGALNYSITIAGLSASQYNLASNYVYIPSGSFQSDLIQFNSSVTGVHRCTITASIGGQVLATVYVSYTIDNAVDLEISQMIFDVQASHKSQWVRTCDKDLVLDELTSAQSLFNNGYIGSAFEDFSNTIGSWLAGSNETTHDGHGERCTHGCSIVKDPVLRVELLNDLGNVLAVIQAYQYANLTSELQVLGSQITSLGSLVKQNLAGIVKIKCLNLFISANSTYTSMMEQFQKNGTIAYTDTVSLQTAISKIRSATVNTQIKMTCEEILSTIGILDNVAFPTSEHYNSIDSNQGHLFVNDY